MNIPMVDLKGQYGDLRAEVEAALRGVLDSGAFILGPQGEALEKEVAAFLGSPHAVGCASGTDALHLALRAAGVGPGDEVITTPFTFIATAEAVAYVGATPVFADIDPRTLNLDPAAAERALTPRTRAILPVHLFGQSADLGPLLDLCRRKNLLLVEDCAQSFGADYRGRMTGTLGAAGCYSFFPSKNLGCYGDGGMLVAADEEVAARARALRNHGSRVRYHHDEVGYNSRLDEMQAAILRVKLPRLSRYNQGRRNAARLYDQGLAGLPLETPFQDGKGTHVFHQYTLLTDRREAIARSLAEAGIASAVYYPVPLHRQEAFRSLASGLTLPHAEHAAERVLSLPMYPELTETQVGRVCEAVRRAFS